MAEEYFRASLEIVMTSRKHLAGLDLVDTVHQAIRRTDAPPHAEGLPRHSSPSSAPSHGSTLNPAVPGAPRAIELPIATMDVHEMAVGETMATVNANTVAEIARHSSGGHERKDGG
jgi:hypothetical protein